MNPAQLLPLLAFLGLASIAKAAERPPNVVFILTDDQGWGDARFAGHPHARTPRLDRLAAEGTWFRQYYVAATVCSPSRAAFMTGHSPARHLIHGHLASRPENEARAMPHWLDPAVTTLPRLLRGAGYATAHFGKWHLGSGPGAPAPSEYGFDVSKTVNSAGPSLGDESRDPWFRARSTELIVDETIAFIRENRDRPFYVNAWTLLPHARLNPTPEQLAVYDELSVSPGDPGFGPWMRDYLGRAGDLRSQMQVYCASLTDLDTQVGRLLDTLDETGLSGNTIVFFSSDNGPEDYRIGNASNAGVGNTGPLRARKRSMYEGGIRTFGLLRWKGKVPAGRVDETSVTGAVDFLPTVCKLAGVALPGDLAPDGEDVSDLWLGAARPRRRPLHWEWLFQVQGPDEGYRPPPLAIRDGDWKLFTDHEGSRAELYHIPADPGEEHDLAAEQPGLVESLRRQALAWVETLPPSPVRDRVRETGLPQERLVKKPARGNEPDRPAGDREASFRRWDRDGDGRLTLAEYRDGLRKDDAPQRFGKFDADRDGLLTLEEFVRAGKPAN